MSELDTWLAADLRETFGGGGPALAQGVGGLKPAALWNFRARAREAMVERLRERGLPAADSDALWIGWAGPLTADARVELLLRDLARLERLLDDPMQAVRVLVVGAGIDAAGQEIQARLSEIAEGAHFDGRLLYVAANDPAAARLAIHGVDLWLDTALEPPGEDASTPGLVDWAMTHGALVLSTSGRADASWTVHSAEPFDARSGRDEHDARRIYELLEREIVASFYDWDTQAIPRAWLDRVRSSLVTKLGAL